MAGKLINWNQQSFTKTWACLLENQQKNQQTGVGNVLLQLRYTKCLTLVIFT
jgi:hypothetical protein